MRDSYAIHGHESLQGKEPKKNVTLTAGCQPKNRGVVEILLKWMIWGGFPPYFWKYPAVFSFNPENPAYSSFIGPERDVMWGKFVDHRWFEMDYSG